MSPSTDTPSLTPTVTLVPGEGVVVRKSAFLCVIEPDVPAALLAEIIGIEAAVAVPDRMPRRGRHLVRKLAEIVATADEPVDIAFAAPDNAGIAIFMCGAVFAETDGERMSPEGDEPFDRAVVWPYEGLGLYLTGAVPAEPGEEVFDLVDGAVPASGALLHTPLGLRGTEIHEVLAPPARVRPEVRAEELAAEQGPVSLAAAAAGVGDDDTTESVVPAATPGAPLTPEIAAPQPFQAASLRTPGPFQSVSLSSAEPFQSSALGAPAPLPPRQAGPPHAPEPARPHYDAFADPHEYVEARAPLPKEAHRKPATEVVQREGSRAYVHGIRCSRGHLNHPQSWLCGVCGIRMDQLTGILVEGERPPLGWLLLDNGSTYLLDEDLVIGREPGSAGGERGRGPKPLRVQDETGQLSRRHVEIRLVEWTVQLVDLGSANGTYVVDPSSANREMRLPAQRPHVLAPGSHVRIGGRHFIFESPHARV